uniref:Uncharacterized protein n=1 Tax=Avena sativa TaxID=4498 RepID=A0ACD6AD37_AVESA
MASLATFEVTPTRVGAGLHNRKITFGKLFLRQILAGSGTNQSDVIEANTATGLGKTTVNNWEIYDGLVSSAQLVAYGQGMHTYAGNWQNWFTMVFEVPRFKGSTLQIMGASPEKSNQWAIVGGTGDFAMAQGIIKITEYKLTGDEKIHELTIDGYCQMELPPVPTPTKMGPWGANGGGLREMEGKSRRLESVTIRSNNIVEKMSFSYINEDGQIQTAGPWGQTDAETTSEKTIKFGPSEFVKGISGGVYVNTSYLTGLRIVTNVTTYGPFGTNPGIAPFNATVLADKTAVGFFVRLNQANANINISMIGVYTI